MRDKLQTLVDFNKNHNLGISFREICEKDLGISRQRGYALMKPLPPTPTAHVETRGRKKLLSAEDVDKVDRVLQNASFDSAAVSWSQIGTEAGFGHIHWITISRAMQERGYKKCWVCQKRWLTFPNAVDRRQFAHELLSWEEQRLRSLRFSDQVHFGLTQKKKLSIIRKPNERCCRDCIARNYDPLKKKRMEPVRFYCSATIGWDYKSELVFHNSNPIPIPRPPPPPQHLQPHPQDPYIDPSLGGPAGNMYPDNSDLSFYGDSTDGLNGLGGVISSPVQQIGLEYYSNPSHSPDLWPVERVWGILEQRVSDVESGDEQVLKQALVKTWASIDQALINGHIEQMHARLKECANEQTG